MGRVSVGMPVPFDKILTEKAMKKGVKNMWYLIWPVLIIVLSNTLYNICQKSTPQGANAFGTMMVTYLVAAGVCAVLFFATAGISHLPEELKKLNWTTFVLGAAIVGLEIGYIFLYRAGWKVSAGSIVCNIALAIVLVFVGVLLYKETITLKQIIGMVLCSAGLILITK